MKIYVKKIEGVTLPEKGSELAAGYDIVATSDPKIVGEQIEALAWARIDYIEYETNLFIAPSTVTFHTLIYPRSSVSRYNLVLANSIGLIDNDYRGMVICRFKYIWQPQDYTGQQTEYKTCQLFGTPNMEKIYKRGDKIAQLVIAPTVQVDWEFVDDLTQTTRGEGGFGSTDSPQHTTIQPKKETIRIGGGATITERYLETGGIPVKERYIDEIRKRSE
jgi:dUTP pyrophosphatase